MREGEGVREREQDGAMGEGGRGVRVGEGEGGRGSEG